MTRLLMVVITASQAISFARHSFDVVIGSIRVQALSPRCIRVEPSGPLGFEDRSTFMVVDRYGWTRGIPIHISSTSLSGTWLITSFYKIFLPRRNPLNFRVYSLAGLLLHTSTGNASNLLSWPAPLQQPAYEIMDYPRFHVPPWGPTPIPDSAEVEPMLIDNNGYDFRNQVFGDVYVFLLGSILHDWKAARSDFISLTGPVPVLPDFAHGIWYTRYWLYTVEEASEEIANFTAGDFGLDVYGLDMNWRTYHCGSYIPHGHQNHCCDQTPNRNCPDHYYDRPNVSLFPNFSEWFEDVHMKGLRVYFNDHPFPRDEQTVPDEVLFRWNGLTQWLAKGLDYWWFDRNWPFSFQPPNLPITTIEPEEKGAGAWKGLSNVVWGSHVYFMITRMWLDSKRSGKRSLILSRDSEASWRPDTKPDLAAGAPAHHRYPVWWLGDGVPIETSISRMVDDGILSFRPFTHSDCGGNGKPPFPTFLRWVQHCTFSPIFRFHAGDRPFGNHRPWEYDTNTQSFIRKYLRLRHMLAPSLVAFGWKTHKTGFPVVARCDLYWPTHQEARSNLQYVFLDDILVAPFFGNDTLPHSIEPGNMTQTHRKVWLPPGLWQDAWDGTILQGPSNITVNKRFEEIPLWHRIGGLVVITSSPGLRLDSQDWSELTLEAFPAVGTRSVTTRSVYELGSSLFTNISMRTDGAHRVIFIVGEPPLKAARSWNLRVHLQIGQHVKNLEIDGVSISTNQAYINSPPSGRGSFFPFGGKSTAPAWQAGIVVEVSLPKDVQPHTVKMIVSAAESDISATYI